MGQHLEPAYERRLLEIAAERDKALADLAAATARADEMAGMAAAEAITRNAAMVRAEKAERHRDELIESGGNMRSDIDDLSWRRAKAERERDAATARAEALDIANQHATQEARRLRVEVDQLNEAAARPDPPVRGGAGEERERLAMEAYRAGNHAGQDPSIDWRVFWRGLPDKDFYRRIADAVVAASRAPAAADVEGLQKRLADGLMPPVQGEGMTFDQAAITDRYRELRGKLSFTKALGQARVEFVARVLGELPERRLAADVEGAARVLHRANASGIPMGCRDFGDTPERIREQYRCIVAEIAAELPERRPAAIVLLKDRQYDVVRIYEDASEAQRHVDHYHPSVVAVWKSPDSRIEWHPAGRPDAAGESIQSL